MSYSYLYEMGNGGLTTTLVIDDDGDPFAIARIAANIEALHTNTGILSTSVVGWRHAALTASDPSIFDVVTSTGSPGPGLRQVSTVSPTVGLWLPTPAAGKITQVRATLKSVSGHSGLPASLPTITLFRIDELTGSPVEIGTETDDSANLTEYEAAHEVIMVIDPGEELSAQRSYMLKIEGESGADAAANLLYVHGVRYYLEEFGS